MNPTLHLTRAERLRRIGELLAKGVALMLAEERTQVCKPNAVSAGERPDVFGIAGESVTGHPLVETERAICDYVQKVRTASPRDIQRACSLSKATAFRALTRLVQRDVLTRTGGTTAVRYQLRA